MNEAFNFQIIRNVLPDFRNLAERQLSGGNHSLCPQLMPEQVGHIVGIIGLGGDMNLNLRTYLSGHGEQSRIRNDKRIRFDFLQFF